MILLCVCFFFPTKSNLSLIHGPNIPGSCVILFYTALDFTFTTRQICNPALFPLWPTCFILSGAISNCRLFFLSSLLDTFQPRGLIFQCHIFLPFHTVHGVLKTRILKSFAIRFTTGPRFVITPCQDLTWVALHGIAHSFIELDTAVFPVISLVNFLWLWFSFCLPSDGEG